MKFGKLQDTSQVKFQLPEYPAWTQGFLDNLPTNDRPCQLYIGCTGWSMKEWVGIVYPEKTKSADYLKHYARQFNTIEFNTTHYRVPSQGMIEKWYHQSTTDFRFCPKVFKLISHTKELGIGNGRIEEFCEAIQGLKEKMGCAFMQLPPYFGHDRLPMLERFFDAWPRDVLLAIEVRHESWFEKPSSFEALAKLAAIYEKPLVITDVAGRRDVLHMGITHPVAMVRFVGNGLTPADYQRLDDWVLRMQQWAKSGVHTIYFFPHQPDNILAPQACDYLYQKVKNLPEFEARGPHLMEENKGQMSLF